MLFARLTDAELECLVDAAFDDGDWGDVSAYCKWVDECTVDPSRYTRLVCIWDKAQRNLRRPFDEIS